MIAPSARSLCLALAFLGAGSAQASAGPAAPPFSTPQERCIVPASNYHRVNPYVLRAILRVESGLNPTAVNRNANGTYDLGMGQTNSMHLAKLKSYGIAPVNLLDGCVSTYVAAWQLAAVTRESGNTWSSIARYHSSTPYFNYRYQVLLSNELVRSGVIRAPILPVPPLKPGAMSKPTPSAQVRAPAAASTQAASVVFDSQSGTPH
jgi:soluble lytic murein transglycosylase-like protein